MHSVLLRWNRQAMGFRQFLLRGVQKAKTEWTLICLACNHRRLSMLAQASVA
jgi:hypothetical protein